MRGSTTRPPALGLADDGRLTLFVEGKGSHTLVLDMVAPLAMTTATQMLSLRLPAPAAVHMTVTVPGNVEVKSGAPVVSRVFDAKAAQTRFELLPPKGDLSLVMTLNSRLKRQDRVVVARSVVVDEVTQAYERLHATVSLAILHRAVDKFRFSVPAGFEVTDVQTPLLARWAIQTEAAPAENAAKVGTSRILEVQLREETTDPVVLTLSAVKTPSTLEKWSLPHLEPLDVVGHVAVVGLVLEERLKAEDIAPAGLIPIDTTVLTKALPATVLAPDLSSIRIRPIVAYYAPQGDFGLSARFVKPPAKLLVTTNLLLTLEDKGQQIRGALALMPEAEKVFAFDFSVPAGWEVTSVTADNKPLPFERYDAAPPPPAGKAAAEGGLATDKPGRIHVTLPEGLDVGQEKRIYFAATSVPKKWFGDWRSMDSEFPVFIVAGAERDTGAIAVDARDDMTARADTLEGLVPAYDFSEAPNPGAEARLAYRFEGHPWRAHLVIERSEPRLTAQTFSFFRVERDALGVHYEVVFDIAGARTRSLSILLPKDTPTALRIRGLDNVALKEYLPAAVGQGAAERRSWTATLAEPRSGRVRLAIDFQSPLAADAKELLLPVVEAGGVAYQTGLLAVEGSAELQVQVADPKPRDVDVGELVDAEYQPGKRLLGTYGFIGAPPPLKVLISREPASALPPALVQKARLTTSLSVAGTAQSAARFLLRTKAQFLEIQLPPHSTLWAVRLDERPAKPQREGDRLLLSLPAASVPIRDLQVVYESPADGLGVWKGVEVLAPKLTLHATPGAAGEEVPAADLEWVLYLPSGYYIVRSEGTVTTDQLGRPPLALTQLASALWTCAGGAGLSHGLIPAFVAVGSHSADEMTAFNYRGGELAPAGGQQGEAYVKAPSSVFNRFYYNPPGPASWFHDLWGQAKSAPQATVENFVGGDINGDGDVDREMVSGGGTGNPAHRTDNSVKMGTLSFDNNATMDFSDIQANNQPVAGLSGTGGAIIDDVQAGSHRNAGWQNTITRDIGRPPSPPMAVATPSAVAPRADGTFALQNGLISANLAGAGSGLTKSTAGTYVLGGGKGVRTYAGGAGGGGAGGMYSQPAAPGGQPAAPATGPGPAVPPAAPQAPAKPGAWALEGVSSLVIDIEPTANATGFRSLGAKPRLELTVADFERLGALGSGLALMVLVAGLALTRSSARRKVLFIVAVAIVATAVPLVLGRMELAIVTNGMFWAALALAIYYPVFALLRWVYRKARGALWPEAARAAAAVLLAVGLGASALLGAGLGGGSAQAAEAPYVVQIVPPPAPVKVPEDALLVPYDPAAKVGLPSVDKLLVPYDKFVDLWNRAYPEKPIEMHAPAAVRDGRGGLYGHPQGRRLPPRRRVDGTGGLHRRVRHRAAAALGRRAGPGRPRRQTRQVEHHRGGGAGGCGRQGGHRQAVGAGFVRGPVRHGQGPAQVGPRNPPAPGEAGRVAGGQRIPAGGARDGGNAQGARCRDRGPAGRRARPAVVRDEGGRRNDRHRPRRHGGAVGPVAAQGGRGATRPVAHGYGPGPVRHPGRSAAHPVGADARFPQGRAGVLHHQPARGVPRREGRGLERARLGSARRGRGRRQGRSEGRRRPATRSGVAQARQGTRDVHGRPVAAGGGADGRQAECGRGVRRAGGGRGGSRAADRIPANRPEPDALGPDCQCDGRDAGRPAARRGGRRQRESAGPETVPGVRLCGGAVQREVGGRAGDAADLGRGPDDPAPGRARAQTGKPHPVCGRPASAVPGPPGVAGGPAAGPRAGPRRV